MIKLNFKVFLLIKIFLIFIILSVKVHAESLTEKNNFIVLGLDTAPIKIKIFSSHTCPHCADFHINVIPKIKEKYIDQGKVQLIFIDFPLDQAAFNASKLLHCLDQKKQINFLDKIYEKQKQWTSGSTIDDINNNLRKIVKALGINSIEFDKCINNQVIGDKILNARINGQKKYSIESTPTIIINEEKLNDNADFKNIEKKIKKII